MLDFFRRYQKGFFIVITIVIIISFSFFGTFQAVHGRDVEDKPAFTAIDGKAVLSSELNDMITFLSQDSYDTAHSSNFFAGNALNDGVIYQDILQTGLADVIAQAYIDEIGQDVQSKLEREKRYKAYQHPKAPFISANQIWSYYAPDIAKNLSKLSTLDTASSGDAFKVRTNLFVAERKFPPAYLKQFLRYQESMHKWLTADPNLSNYDLSLFGYHSAQDWFGRRFIELSAQFIINSAKYAESKGYSVSKEEALTSLFENCEEFLQNSEESHLLTTKNPADYFQEQLRHLNMDQGRLVKVWSQVLLFRRLFFDNADSILVHPLSYQDFYNHLNEYVDIDLYQLSPVFALRTQQDLEKCILYHSAVAKDGKNSEFSSAENFKQASDVKKNYPELVEKPYHLIWKETNKEYLQAKVGVKTMWDWQVVDVNWQELKTRYPELAKGKDETTDDRLRLIDGLDPARRAMLESYSRQEIVNLHPEWLKDALANADAHNEVVRIRASEGKLPFSGVTDRVSLMQLLDNATVNMQDEGLASFSQDGVHYYSITVVDHNAPEEIISYQSAKNDGTLTELMKKNPSKETFEAVWVELDKKAENMKSSYPNLDWQDKSKARIAAYLLPYMLQMKQSVQQNPDSEANWVIDKADQNGSGNEYKLIKSRERLTRKDSQFLVDPVTAFSLDVSAKSGIGSYQANGFSFYNVVAKGFLPSDTQVRQKLFEVRDTLGNDAICKLGLSIMAKMPPSPALKSTQDE